MNIDKALKKDYEDLPIRDLPRQHITALQGISERQGKLLEQALGVRTIEDLATLKFVLWAQSIVDLAPTDTTGLPDRNQAVAARLAAADAAAAAPAPQADAPAPTPTPAPAPAAPQAKGGTAKAGTVPALWRFDTADAAFGIFVDAEGCWIANQRGDVFLLDREAAVRKQFKLPKGSMCLVGDGRFIYAGCNDGNVYDLTGDVPVAAYEIGDSNIYWLDIAGGNLAVGDAAGRVAAFDFEQQPLFKVKSGGTSVWMVRCAREAVYVGNSVGVSALAWADGAEQWSQSVGAVLFGWQEGDALYAGTSSSKVHQVFNDGRRGQTYVCDGGIFSCATAEGGEYVFAGDSGDNVYCFAKDGKRLWKLKTNAGAALSMQYHDQRLYVVTRLGALLCVDVSAEAIARAQAGQASVARTVAAPRTGGRAPVQQAQQVERTRDAGSGVVVECYFEGSRLRVRPVSQGYRADFHVQFPRGLREDGARFVVDELVENGSFYRARGNIRRLDA